MFNFHLLRGKIESVIYLAFIIFMLIIMNTGDANAQVRLAVGAGLVATEKGPKITGILNVGYEVGNFSTAIDIRSAIGQIQAFFGLQAGYNFMISEDVYFRPYGGCWMRKTGNTSPEDRYVKNGQTEVLATTPPGDLNGYNFGIGAQYLWNHLWIDAAYLTEFRVAVGVTFKF